MSENQYTEDNIRSLDWKEHIRLRPGMYIGKLGDGAAADDGIYILVKEVVDNCIDEFVMGNGKRIDIKVKDGKVTVRDYGRGIPLGKVVEVVSKMNTGEVANTNLHAAFKLILDVAVKNNVPQAEMPETLVIFSDMQFDQGVDRDESAIEMIERKYKAAGYTVPQVVFWNLNAAYGNTPVKFDKRGTALVSGFSPAVAGGIMGGNMDDFTPEAIMLKTVMKDRYSI